MYKTYRFPKFPNPEIDRTYKKKKRTLVNVSLKIKKTKVSQRFIAKLTNFVYLKTVDIRRPTKKRKEMLVNVSLKKILKLIKFRNVSLQNLPFAYPKTVDLQK